MNARQLIALMLLTMAMACWALTLSTKYSPEIQEPKPPQIPEIPLIELAVNEQAYSGETIKVSGSLKYIKTETVEYTVYIPIMVGEIPIMMPTTRHKYYYIYKLTDSPDDIIFVYVISSQKLPTEYEVTITGNVKAESEHEIGGKIGNGEEVNHIISVYSWEQKPGTW